MISTLPPAADDRLIPAVLRAPPLPREAASQRLGRVARHSRPIRALVREPVRYPSLLALLLSAGHTSRAKHAPLEPYVDTIRGWVGFRTPERVLVIDRRTLDQALRDPRMAATTELLGTRNGWALLARLLSEGWRPPGAHEG